MFSMFQRKACLPWGGSVTLYSMALLCFRLTGQKGGRDQAALPKPLIPPLDALLPDCVLDSVIEMLDSLWRHFRHTIP